MGRRVVTTDWSRYGRRLAEFEVVLRVQAGLRELLDFGANVWEWCQDSFTREVQKIPADGSAFVGEGNERVLRGGCFHNWAIHCTVSKQYQIERDYHDGCIGFRLVLSIA